MTDLGHLVAGLTIMGLLTLLVWGGIVATAAELGVPAGWLGIEVGLVLQLLVLRCTRGSAGGLPASL